MDILPAIRLIQKQERGRQGRTRYQKFLEDLLNAQKKRKTLPGNPV